MPSVSFVDVASAAEQLNVSDDRVRKLIHSGRLPAERLGSRYIIEASVVAQLARSSRSAGRPMGPERSWAAIAEICNDGLIDLPLRHWQRARARSSVRQLAVSSLFGVLSGRASVCQYRAHPAAIGRLRDDGRLVRAGASAAQEHGMEIVAADEVEAYVKPDDRDKVEVDYALVPVSAHGNVLLREPMPWWPFPSDLQAVPPLVAALDLWDSDDARSRRAASNWLRDRLGPPD